MPKSWNVELNSKLEKASSCNLELKSKSWNLEILKSWNISKSWYRLSPELTGVQDLEILKSWNISKSWNTIGSSSEILKYTDNSRLDFRILKSWNLEILKSWITEFKIGFWILKSWNLEIRASFCAGLRWLLDSGQSHGWALSWPDPVSNAWLSRWYVT